MWTTLEQLIVCFLVQNGLMIINQNWIKVKYGDLYDWNQAKFLKILTEYESFCKHGPDPPSPPQKIWSNWLGGNLANITKGKTSKDVFFFFLFNIKAQFLLFLQYFYNSKLPWQQPQQKAVSKLWNLPPAGSSEKSPWSRGSATLDNIRNKDQKPTGKDAGNSPGQQVSTDKESGL